MIKQFYISESVKFFKENIKKIYGLEEYHDTSAPCLFIGQYKAFDVDLLRKHTGPSIVLWAGIDARKAHGLADLNIVISTQQTEYFQEKNILFKYIPFCWTPDIIKKQKLSRGNGIYCYAPNEIYGLSIAKRLQEDYPMTITQSPRELTKKELEKVYQKTMLNLRLRNKSDGSATTVQECGLRGIPSIWNGDMPFTKPWNAESDIRKGIEWAKGLSPKERQTIASAFRAKLHTAIYDTFRLFDVF